MTITCSLCLQKANTVIKDKHVASLRLQLRKPDEIYCQTRFIAHRVKSNFNSIKHCCLLSDSLQLPAPSASCSVSKLITTSLVFCTAFHWLQNLMQLCKDPLKCFPPHRNFCLHTAQEHSAQNLFPNFIEQARSITWCSDSIVVVIAQLCHWVLLFDVWLQNFFIPYFSLEYY